MRSPPFSGKTSLAKVFGIYHTKKVPMARVIYLSMLCCRTTHGVSVAEAENRFLEHWRNCAIDVRKNSAYLCERLLEDWFTVIGKGIACRTVIIIDEAQILYHLGMDFLLWKTIKSAQQGGNIHFLVFAAYGEPPRDININKRWDCVTPFAFKCSVGIAELRLHERECRDMFRAVSRFQQGRFLAPIPLGIFSFPYFFLFS